MHYLYFGTESTQVTSFVDITAHSISKTITNFVGNSTLLNAEFGLKFKYTYLL